MALNAFGDEQLTKVTVSPVIRPPNSFIHHFFRLHSVFSRGSLACFLFAVSSLDGMLLKLLVFPLLLLALTLHLSKLPWMNHPGWSAPVFSAHPLFFSFSTYHGIPLSRWKDEDNDQMRKNGRG